MKQSQNFRRIKLPCIAFAAVAVLYLLNFAVYGFYPFGERSIAWCDLEQQYLPLLMELRGIIRDSGSLLLGKGGGGMNLWGVFLFFVSSPLSLLSLLVSEEKMIYFINLLTILKLALCGASASFYFGRLYRRMSGGFNVLLSVMYTFSGYVMMYYQNNMWLDMMIIFPMLLLSMFRLCKSGRWGAYAVMLSLAMFMNFYISYMLVLYIVISFGIMLLFCCKKEHRGERAVKFLAADVCAGLMTAVVWLPSIKQFSSSGRGESTAELFLGGTFLENSLDKLAMLSCTSVVFAAIIIMLFRRRLFSSGNAAFFGIMTVIMLVGAFISPVNKLWHTGSYQAYPLRYGFIIVLMGLSVCAVLLSVRERKAQNRNADKRQLLILLLYVTAALPGLIYSDKLTSYMNSLWVEGIDAAVAIGYGALGAAVYAIFILNYRRARTNSRFAVFLMCGVMLCESLLSFSVYMGNTRDVTARFNQTMELSGKIDDHEYYRIKSMKRYFYSNMLEAMGFSSIGHYTSLTNRDFLFTAKQLGYSAYWLDISSNGGTLITDAFLMNKYIVGVNSDMNALYEQYDIEDVLKIYRNTVVSDGAVVSGVSPEELGGFTGTGRMESSAYIAEKLYGAKDIISTVEPYSYENLNYYEEDGEKHFEIDDTSEEAYINFSLFADGSQELYFDLFSNYSTALTEPYFESVSVYVNGKLAEGTYPNKRANGIIDLGTFENKYVSIKITVHKDFTVDEFGVYMLDTEKVCDCVAAAETGRIELDGNKIRITVQSPDGGWVYIPFAYSGGYSAELNGVKTVISKTLGSFMAIRLNEGENELVLTYYPEGFVLGAAISVAGALLFVLTMIFMRGLKVPEGIGRIAERAVVFVSLAALAVIYVIAVVVWMIMQL